MRASPSAKNRDTAAFLGFSLLGLFVFFVPVSLNGKNTIPLDHIITFFRTGLPLFSRYFALLMVMLGAWDALRAVKRKKDASALVLALFKISGLAAALIFLFSGQPAFLMQSDVLPFLYEKLVTPVALIVPLGAVFLAFLVDYGLMEFSGSLLQPFMRRLFHTPGRSAVDAVASFVGSYSIGLLITDRVYREGRYTTREAAIIATGFSTVSATFMVIVAQTLDMMSLWNFYFWSTLLTTFAVTALTVRLWPLRRMPDWRRPAGQKKESNKEAHTDNALAEAWHKALRAARQAPPLKQSLAENLNDGLRMAASIVSMILSVGLLGILLVKYSPLFDWSAWLFVPLAKLFSLPEPHLTGKALSLGISEMFLPSLLVSGSDLITRYIIGVTSVSSILFFSASIPCILSTHIPLKIGDLLWIWLERTLLSFILAAITARVFL